MIKYGKPYGDIADMKRNMRTDNEKYLSEQKRIARMYNDQPVRETCMVCGERIENIDFISHRIKYSFCRKCGHVNGHHKDTKAFTEAVYVTGNYDINYKAETHDEYVNRANIIYMPKVQFLSSILKEENAAFNNIRLLDVGAGSGYFIYSLMQYGLSDVSGIEVSPVQVEFGNKMIGENKLITISEDKAASVIASSEAKVISFIGCLEHLNNLQEILNQVELNDNIEYIYFSVPMFSFSVILESLFPDVYGRVLGGAHTHCFTNDSIEYMLSHHGFKNIGEWRFGTDAGDLLRTVEVRERQLGNNMLAEVFSRQFTEIIDKVQLLMDKQNFSSEIHIVAKRIV